MRRLLAICVLAVTACSAASSDDDGGETSGSDIVGGTRDLRWPASGYLTSGDEKCSGTLVAPNVVVTAAHCVLRADVKTWSFGTGDRGGQTVRVIEQKVHPEFHARPEGMIDVPYYLRKNDVAWLVLEHTVSTKPAELPTAEPETGCNVQAIGYRDGVRKSTPACVELNVQLGDDPIFEVHPQNRSGLCNADGDEGSPVVLRDASRDVLVGFYVGSVTQGLTDCKPSVQFLDGYESAFGYRDFFAEGIARGAQLTATSGTR